MAAGLDLGDKHTYLCLIDTDTGDVIEEGRLRTSPQALGQRFEGCEPMRIAIEVGTHSPWVSRLLEERGHQVLVANARKLRLIYQNKRKTDKIDAQNLARLARLDPKLLWPRSSTVTSIRRRTWHYCARARLWSKPAHSWSTTLGGASRLSELACPSARRRVFTRRQRRRYPKSSRRSWGPCWRRSPPLPRADQRLRA